MDRQSSFPQPSPQDPGPTLPSTRARRPRRLLATVAATAVIAGVGGVGAGYAAGNAFGGSTTASAGGSTQQQTGVSGGDTGGIESIPGPGWSFSDGAGPGYRQLPRSPFDTEGQSGGAGGSQSTDTTTKASGSQLTGLVRITSTLKYAGARAAGTGMVLSSNGEVVTNHHVVEGSTSLKATVMSTGKTYTAKVVGTDAKDDVAVLQLVGASGLDTVTTSTTGPSVGDPVTAVGDADGTVNYLSAASGTVLALDQSITTQSQGSAKSERLTGLMKISSDVISGDSGGATYDANGTVVGMTTAASSGSADVVGYAVPIAKVLNVADDLQNGVAGSNYDYTLPAFLGVGLGRSGTTVQGVYQGLPAADAGIVAGDRIIAVGTTSVTSSTQLQNAIARLSPGARVAITWEDTTGTSHTSTVTLATGPVE